MVQAFCSCHCPPFAQSSVHWHLQHVQGLTVTDVDLTDRDSCSWAHKELIWGRGRGRVKVEMDCELQL